VHVLSAFITGLGWVSVSGAGMGRNADPFDLSEGVLPGSSIKTSFTGQAFRRFGRLDRFSKVGLNAIAYAMQDAGFDRWEEKRDIGVIVSTVFGCIKTDLDYYRTVMIKNGIFADPNLFTYTLPNSFLGHASIIFGLTGINFVINDKTGSGISALLSALDCISLGECDSILAGICDVEPPPDFPVSGKTPPGAIFAVIEKTLRNQARTPYGRLSADNNGTLFFNESEIKDISMCVKKCLRAER
jgi:3-oxoacyl-[acyl-carrier-protein] synthase II